MKKVVLVLLVVVISMLAVSSAFAAEPMPPCNDMDGDGSPSGYEYAHGHIVALAHLGILARDINPARIWALLPAARADDPGFKLAVRLI